MPGLIEDYAMLTVVFAAQRWPIVVALSRFGVFDGLGVTHSASDDVFPDTATLSFHNATYTSDYLAFQGVETSTNVRQGDGYAPLDAPTQQQQNLVATFDAPPYAVHALTVALLAVVLFGTALQDPETAVSTVVGDDHLSRRSRAKR